KLEERAMGDAGVVANADCGRRGGVQERVGADEKAPRPDLEPGRQIAREPVVRQPAAHGALSVTSAGVPAAHAPAGPARARTVPPPTVRPAPAGAALRVR